MGGPPVVATTPMQWSLSVLMLAEPFDWMTGVPISFCPWQFLDTLCSPINTGHSDLCPALLCQSAVIGGSSTHRLRGPSSLSESLRWSRYMHAPPPPAAVAPAETPTLRRTHEHVGLSCILTHAQHKVCAASQSHINHSAAARLTCMALRQAQAASRARLCGQPFCTDDIAQHGLSSACHAGRGVRHDLHPRGSGTATCALTLTRTADAVGYQRRDIRTHSTQVTSPMLAVQTDVSRRLTCANECHDLYRDGQTCSAKQDIGWSISDMPVSFWEALAPGDGAGAHAAAEGRDGAAGRGPGPDAGRRRRGEGPSAAIPGVYDGALRAGRCFGVPQLMLSANKDVGAGLAAGTGTWLDTEQAEQCCVRVAAGRSGCGERVARASDGPCVHDDHDTAMTKAPPLLTSLVSSMVLQRAQ